MTPPAQEDVYRPHKPKNLFKCIVPGCLSSTTSNIAKLHSFPWRDMPRAEKWMSAVGRRDLVGAPAKALLRLRVCDLHFDRKLRRGKNHKLFDSSAVPTLRLAAVRNGGPPGPPARRAPVGGPPGPAARRAPGGRPPGPPASAPEPAAGPSPAPAHTPIRVPKELARFLALRETLARSNTARAPADFDARFCRRALRLRHAAPAAYDVLWRALRLPAPARLARLPLPAGTRLHKAALAALRARLARLPAAARDAALCLDEVQLSPRAFYYADRDRVVGLEELDGSLRARPAARALLLAARGLRPGARWTQPLAYWLLAEGTDPRALAAAARRALAALAAAGVRVRLVLSALGPTFAGLARALRASPARPYVRDASLGRVPFLHDPEQLLLTLRDTLRAYDVLLRGPDGAALRASWAHVEALRSEDRARPARLLPELTRARVAPTPAEAARPRHALAALTARVGAALAAGDAARRGTARLVALAGSLGSGLRVLRADAAARARLRRRADELTAALGDMRVVSWAGEEHGAEEFSRALRLTLEGALLLAADCAEPLALARCGLRPLRRWAERAEGAAPKEFRARFRRWAARHVARPVAARGPVGDLHALLEAAEADDADADSASDAEDARAVSAGPLRHALRPARGAAGLLREMRRAHGCAAWRRWARDGRRWRALLAELDARFRRQWAGRVPNAAVCARTVAALAPALDAPERLPCACFPRDTLCRLYARFRLRAALLALNAPVRADLAAWSFA